MMSLTACNQENKVQEEAFDYTVEQFADLQLLRFKVHGFDELPLEQKKLVYYLSHSSPGPRGPRRVLPAFGQKKSSFLACASPCWDPRALSPLPSPTLRSRPQMPCAPSPDTEAPEAG